MCIDNGSQPPGQAVAILRAPMPSGDRGDRTSDHQQWTLAFSNPQRNERHLDGFTKYQLWTNGSAVRFSEKDQLCIHQSGDLSKPLDISRGGFLHQETFGANRDVASRTLAGSLSQRLDLDVSQSGVIGRAITIIRDGRECLHGVVGWGAG
ncbi:hypothetical protein ACLMJK_004426 [Lecanora helva]